MSHSASSVGVAWAVVGWLALFPGGAAPAQQTRQGLQGFEEDPSIPGETELVPSLRADTTLLRKLDAARGFLERGAWVEAVPLLQALLDTPEDALVAIKHTPKVGKEVVRWTGLRAEAARLLGTLPEGGRAFCHAAYGPAARALLAHARRKGDAHLLAEVTRRYPHTAAGVEATALLGRYHLDRARPGLATVYFQRLIDREDAEDLPPATWFYAAVALRRAGAKDGADHAQRRLAARARDGLRLGGRRMSLTELQEELDRVEASGAARPTMRRHSLPSLEARWTRPTASEPLTRSWLEVAQEQQLTHGKAVLAAGMPIIAGGQVVYRSYHGLHAVSVRTGRQAWEAPSSWGLDGMASQPAYASQLESWVSAYLEGRASPQVLFGNAVLGTLSTDGERIYAVEDLAVPPYGIYSRPRRRWQELPGVELGPELTQAAESSRLVAIDAASGKLVWELGNRGGAPPADALGESYFLGPPLPLEGRLYVLTEKSNEISLVCLNAADGALQWRQPLAYAPTRLRYDPGRRLQAAVPVYADGVLVCPTTAGLIVGVDLTGLGLVWAYPYRSEPLTVALSSMERRRRDVRPRINAEWDAATVVVDRGRILVSAADSPAVHCLNLRDGSLLWHARRADDDLYVAGVWAAKVLVVGKRACRALDLSDGKERWQVQTGAPSGRGMARGNAYYLPLKEAAAEKGPAIYAIDCREGRLTARMPWPAKEAPGNLLFWQGNVVSQTATAVTGCGRRCCFWE
jgi:outer membrane protein assembly factor BamB